MAKDLRSRTPGTEAAAGAREPARRRTGPIVLDGVALAARRAPGLAERARVVTDRRGRPPAVLLIAFADAAGRASFSAKKVRAGRAVGVKATQLVVPFGSDTAAALRSVRHALEDETLDAVFLEFPFPPGIDGDALTEVIPPALDVDIMTAARIRAFMDGADPRPPLTAAAALALVDGYGVGIAGRACAVVADDSPFARMFAQAFERRGATPARLVSPDSAHLAGDLADAEVAIIAAGRPGLVPTSLLTGGAVAIDAGYFNPGGVGDVDVSAGLTHLQAFAPVPGGIGPMTISALLDRVVEFAEADGAVKSPP